MASVEDRGVIEAHGAQHPPEARRPVRRRVAIEHDEGAMADALGGEGLGELIERRQGEAELGLRVGEFAAKIEKGRARDVTLVVVGAAAFSVVAAFGARPEIGRAVEDTKRRRAHAAREFLGRNQRCGLCHVALPGLGERRLAQN